MTATGPNDPTPHSERRMEDAERPHADPEAVDRRAAADERTEPSPHDTTVADERQHRSATDARRDAAEAELRRDRTDRDVPRARTETELRHDREAVVARERERFGGVKVGSAFFGWLTATGALVLLTALAAAIAALVATLSGGGIDDAVEGAERNLEAAGLWGIIILLAIWFVAYYAGGYVAGRMARFDGAKQGVAVWIWAVAIAILAALVGMVAGQNFAVPPGSMPTLPLPEDQAATAAIISAVAVALVALIGAVLGGMAGMRFHRRVDRAGFEVPPEHRA